MIGTDEPDQQDAMEDIGERLVEALEKLVLAKAPTVQVAAPVVQVAPPVIQIPRPVPTVPHGWTFTVTARDAAGRIQTLTATPSA
jgi:hypothetical protein